MNKELPFIRIKITLDGHQNNGLDCIVQEHNSLFYKIVSIGSLNGHYISRLACTVIDSDMMGNSKTTVSVGTDPYFWNSHMVGGDKYTPSYEIGLSQSEVEKYGDPSLPPPKFGEKEYVICSGIHFDDGKEHPHQPRNIKSGIVSCGRRHHNCYVLLAEAYEGLYKGKTVMGFITSKDLFVDRKEAHRIAFEAGQTPTDGQCLFSEDIY